MIKIVPPNQVVADAFKSIREFLHDYQTQFKNVEKRIDNLVQEQNRIVDKIIETLAQQQERQNTAENIVKNLAKQQTNFNVIESRIDSLKQQQTHELKHYQTNCNKKATANLE